MKTIQPSANKHQWPRKAVESVECRKRDLVIRIADWSRQKDEPAFDVECYVGGVYDCNLSKTFCMRGGMAEAVGLTSDTKQQAKAKAVAFAQAQIAALL